MEIISFEKNFIKKNKIAIFLLVVIIAITYGIKLYNLSISIDNEAAIVTADSIYSAWDSMGRIGLTFLKKILGVSVYNPYLAISTMIVLLLFICILYTSIFEYILKDLKSWHFLVFSSIFVTSPILAEQLGFVMQSVEVLIGMACLGLALLLFFKYLEDGEKNKIIFIIILLIFSFSIYQALSTVFVSFAISTVLLYYIKNKPTSKCVWFIIIKLIVVFFLSYILYYCMTLLYFKFSGISRTDYTGDQIKWGILGLKQILCNLKNYILSSYFAKNIHYNYNLLITTIFVILYALSQMLQKKYNYLFYLIIIALLISPFFMGIILGDTPSIRTELCKVYTIAFLNMFILYLLDAEKVMLFEKALMLLIVVLSINNQIIHTTRLYYTEYITNLEQYTISEKISSEIEDITGEYSPKENIIFVGRLNLNRNESCYNKSQLELVGYSFYEVSFSTSHGTYLMRNYMKTLGYNYVYPTNEQIESAELNSKSMPSWPQKGSIQKFDNYVIVKLSD